jgi:hypothetical protein
VTAKLTQLRTQFEQLLNQTIPKCVTYEKLGFFHDSRIVYHDTEKSNIRNFLAKPINCVKLLFRASDHRFCIKKFHEKSDGVANTLTIVWTEFDRKIGGFTPLKWSSQGTGAWIADNSKESFIFSLTHNDKFTLQIPGDAIYTGPGYGPIFGCGNDFRVYDKANS